MRFLSFWAHHSISVPIVVFLIHVLNNKMWCTRRQQEARMSFPSLFHFHQSTWAPSSVNLIQYLLSLRTSSLQPLSLVFVRYSDDHQRQFATKRAIQGWLYHPQTVHATGTRSNVFSGFLVPHSLFPSLPGRVMPFASRAAIHLTSAEDPTSRQHNTNAAFESSGSCALGPACWLNRSDLIIKVR